MAQFKGFYIPSFSATVNVAWETVKALWPENSPCMELLRGPSSGQAGGYDQQFREGVDGAEMTTLNNGAGTSYTGEKHVTMAEESFSYQRSGDKIRQGSVSSGFSEYDEGGGEFGSGTPINEWQAAWNVTNAIQGMFIVSLPFAVLRGGYWAIFAMIGVAHICCYTGKILVECLYEVDVATGQRVRVRDSYVAIAKECFGPRVGARIVNIAQIIELLMTCILYVVVCGDLMIGCFPEGAIDTRSWMMLIGIFLVPLGFLKSLHHVSVLSFWCTMAHLFINAIIIGYCILEIGDWGWSKVKWSIDMETFPISLGVIVFSYTSQIFLPTLEGNLIDRSKFNWMLDWSHIAAAAFKSIFGWVCFLTFQNDTQQVITNNLHSAGFKGLVNFCLVLKAMLSYPLPYYAACELLERALFRGKPKTPFPTIWTLDRELKVWGLAWRIGVILFTILMAIFIPHFSILMGFIGSFTGTMLSFIWPCYFHLKLKRNSMDSKEVAYDCFVIFLGVLFGVIGVYDSGKALIKAFEIGLPF
ncbi:vesicular inhibitory amino acid transporter [Phymastichus coffea]|uniref:vesicular inhibitory amino acid transporter n=1 Tax=Phymastichus coffea TaxID=108790 RepID=UPI00273B6E29|nr:vesicular inhibitory amino acid transporter [Phymastichus coffea]